MSLAAKRLDSIQYPETDDMGEHEIQRFIAELLRPLIERWLLIVRRVAHAGADQFFYYVEGDPRRYRAPDVYVIDGVPQDIPEVGVWKTWEGHRPSFALEIVGNDWKKDYFEAPVDYDAMGVLEAIIFDPAATARSRKRVRWQVFRRTQRGGLELVEKGMGDRVFSETLGAWLRLVDEKGHPRLRLGEGPQGDTLLPTDAERVVVETIGRRIAEAQSEAEREARLVEREARLAADEARLRAEAAVARLQAELDALRRAR